MSVVVTRSVRCISTLPRSRGSAVSSPAPRPVRPPRPRVGHRGAGRVPVQVSVRGVLGWLCVYSWKWRGRPRFAPQQPFPAFFTFSCSRSFSVWTRVNSRAEDWFSSSKSSIRWQLSSGSGPVIQTTVTDLAQNVQQFLFARPATRKQLRPRLVGNAGNQVHPNGLHARNYFAGFWVIAVPPVFTCGPKIVCGSRLLLNMYFAVSGMS